MFAMRPRPPVPYKWTEVLIKISYPELNTVDYQIKVLHSRKNFKFVEQGPYILMLYPDGTTSDKRTTWELVE
jgi:hypothetical protein